MSSTIEDLAADLGKPVTEVLEVAKHFTTQPCHFLSTEVPANVESRIRAWYQED
jgi:hypothetical protein